MPVILRCFRIAGFLFSKEGCYITQNEVNAVFDEQVRLCADTLKRKTKEYTGDDPDRLGAFKAAAVLQHTTPQRALAGMLAKHIVSLYDMCFAEETVYPMDTWDEKITDSLNYLFLLKAIGLCHLFERSPGRKNIWRSLSAKLQRTCGTDEKADLSNRKCNRCI